MNTAWVYLCRDASDRVIYVGATGDLFARLAQHRDKAFWAYTVARVSATVHPSMSAALAAEREAIRLLDPRWNVRGRWQNRLRWDAEDYSDYHMAISLGLSPDTAQNRLHLVRVATECERRFGVVIGAPSKAS
jgi:predicted GIY-YIG superfamily endonuclease